MVCNAWVNDTGIARSAVDRYLERFLDEQREALARNGVMGVLYDDAAEFVRRPGKRARPVMYLLGARLFAPGPDWLSPSRLAVAASLELMHAFVLVHDDIIDRSDMRRGKPSLHRLTERRLSQFGERGRTAENIALVMGDILFALGQRCLIGGRGESALPQLDRLLGYILETGAGEISDIVFGSRDIGKVGLDEIELMYLQKTTRYTIEAPLVLAAMESGVAAGGLEELASIAAPAGLAFQIGNDLAEFERFEVSDAAVPDDLLEGKKTYLMRAAFEMLGEQDRVILQLCLNGIRPSEATVSKVRELVVKSGACSRLQRACAELYALAVARAETAAFDGPVREGLGGILAMLGELAGARRAEAIA